MFRLLAVAALLYSYFQIKTGLPQVAGRKPATVWLSLWVEFFITVILLAAPWIARSFPECVHFGWRRFSDYTPTQRDRIMPLFKGMVGLMALAATSFWASTFINSSRSPAPDSLPCRHRSSG